MSNLSRQDTVQPRRLRRLRRLRRSRRNRWMVGVCGGLGERYGITPVIPRLLLIGIGIAFTPPLLGIAYIFGWLLIPEEPEELEPWPPYGADQESDEPGHAEPP